MRLLFILILFVSATTLAGEVPKQTIVTSSNAARLGFRLEPMDVGLSDVRGFRFWFPSKKDDCRAGRVQVTLTDLDGRQLFISSADYPVTDSAPHLLLAYHAEIMDMSLSVQYCCINGKPPLACKTAYAIVSVSNYFSNKMEN